MKPAMSRCPDCYPYPPRHFANWVTDCTELVAFPVFEKLTPHFLVAKGEKVINDIFLKMKLFSLEKDFALVDINPISAVFIAAARKHGIEFQIFRSPFGYADLFRMTVGGRSFDFEKLPRAEFLENHRISNQIDDKWKVKQWLRARDLPALAGRAYWWFAKKKAIGFAKTIGFPVVIKPRRGSLSQHMYRNIRNERELAGAIDNVIRHSPVFLVEKYLPNCNFYRITVVDFDQWFVVQRTPPHVVGDGVHTVRDLMKKFGLSPDHSDADTIKEQGVSLDSVPGKGSVVYIHHKIIMGLGARFEEIDRELLPVENVKLFQDVAMRFGSRLVGIDFAAEDIEKPWPKQMCAILELNSLPNIQLHTFIYGNKKENKVAEALVGLVKKYYH